jgi:tripartite ATP-independent transporter DctP family solute receptor
MKMAIEDLPYMWKDVEHAREAYKGEFGEQLADIISEQGLTQIGYLEWGPRHVTNNEKPIVEPEDLEGVNIRVAETALRVDAFEQVGALPTVMAFSEVYGALQQGALDAQENPLSVINAAKFYEVQDYLSLTGHFYNTVMMVVETDTWDQISEEDQQLIKDEASSISEEVAEMNDTKEEEYLTELEENGMQINDDVNTEAFREAMLPVYDQWEEEVFGEELMNVYREASGWEE